MLKLYATLVLLLGVVSLGIAVWGTWITATIITDLISTELYQMEYWVGLALFWIIGIAGIASGIGMLQRYSLAIRLWEFFSWVLAVFIVLWAVQDALRADVGIDNLIEAVTFGVIAVLATMVRRQEKYRATT